MQINCNFPKIIIFCCFFSSDDINYITNNVLRRNKLTFLLRWLFLIVAGTPVGSPCMLNMLVG